MQTNCILSAPILIPLCMQLRILSAFVCFYQNLEFLSLNTMLVVEGMLVVDKQCCDKFPVPQIDRKSKQVKEQ